ncbi:GNAT family N-acetyltransferase [Methanospirillum lacunae]|uniref:GNAT family N-acetyltransferase n=1 Tax=Methanospirillum lacunae TaxID=668570 RepID=A0A2V2MU26_9EURY|nr:GNAT family N-acetyltransferase [Methanospirillum lacunae]PWR71462.1 GNAT family N-acetyltransferase [Methanospirillum lacunae]
MTDHNSIVNFSPLSITDGPDVISIFNYYILNNNAAFLEQPVPDTFFEYMLGLLGLFPSVGIRRDGHIIGFGMLRPHNSMPAFAHTAEITYFIHPDYTGKGIGGEILSYLEMKGREIGICNILAQISSLNEGSIRFHHKHGFVHCGRFMNVGKKSGIFFDTVWMQKNI